MISVCRRSIWALLSRLVTLSSCHLVLLFAVSGCTPRSAPPVWLAHVATLSGSDKEVGEAAARGIRLAVEEINKNADQGFGPPLKVIHSDTRGKLDAFESEAVRIVAVNRVAFLLGGTTPDEVERLDRAHATVITPCGQRPRGGSDGIYCTGISPSQRGKALARFAVQDLKADSVVLLYDDRRDDLGGVVEALARELPLAASKDTPAPSVRRLHFGKDIKLGDLVLSLDKAPAKVLIFAGHADELGVLGALQVPVIFAGDEVSIRYLAGRQGGLKALYWLTAFATGEDFPPASDFARRYKAAFSDEADVHAALAYEDVKVLYEALCRAKDTLTVKRIREELDKLKDFPGLDGALSFTKERQLARAAFVARLEGQSAKTVKRVEPEN
jgi:branched-chain amino acid transport system substrate-binding protein